MKKSTISKCTITREGKILITFSDGKLSTMDKEAIELCKALDFPLPRTGAEFNVEPTMDAANVPSDTWVRIVF